MSSDSTGNSPLNHSSLIIHHSSLVLLCAALLAAGTPADAQQYPTRPVRVLIPFTAGSAADIIARAMEPALRDRLRQPLVIDNRGGAGGNIAAELTAKSTPDGHTISNPKYRSGRRWSRRQAPASIDVEG